MRTLVEHIVNEARRHEELKSRILDHMHRRYQEVAGDLPREGNHHYAAAQDHLADNAHDEFHTHPDYDRKRINLRALAKKVTSRYGNDSAESRRNDARQDRAYARRWGDNVYPKKPRAKKPKPGNYPGVSAKGKYTRGYRRGVGSS